MTITFSMRSFSDEMEKIALSQRLMGRAHTKALNLAEKYRRQAKKWALGGDGLSSLGIKLKDPLRSEKARAKAERYERLVKKLETRLEPTALAKKLERRAPKRKPFVPVSQAPRSTAAPPSKPAADPQLPPPTSGYDAMYQYRLTHTAPSAPPRPIAASTPGRLRLLQV